MSDLMNGRIMTIFLLTQFKIFPLEKTDNISIDTMLYFSTGEQRSDSY